MKKNTEFTLYFSLFTTAGALIANPGTITKKISIDGAAIGDITASVTEEDTTYGQLSVVLSAAEMNGTGIWVSIKDDTSGCVPYIVTLYPDAFTPGEIGTAVITNAAGTDVAADIIAIKGVVDTIQADTDLLDDVSGGLADIHTDVGTLATTVGAAGAGLTAITGAKLHADYDAAKSAAAAGAKMDLVDAPNGTAIAALAAAIEAAIINEGDATAVLQAIADKIAGDWTAGDLSAVAIASAVKTALEAAGTHLTLIKAVTDAQGAAGAGLTALGDTRLANLDAAISSRSTYAGEDTAGTTTLLTRLSALWAAQLDAAISTRLATTGYTAPDNAGITTIAGYLDTEIASILAAVDTEIATLVSELAKVPKSDSTVSWNATAKAAIAVAFLDSLLSAGDADALNARTVRSALRAIRNKQSVNEAGDTLTVTKENDTDAAWTAAITTDAASEPITAIDPA